MSYSDFIVCVLFVTAVNASLLFFFFIFQLVYRRRHGNP
jgi:hypothetical protein